MEFTDVAEIAPTTSNLLAGLVVPIPTLPLARTVRPEPAVELDAMRATVPLVTALVLATYSKPLVELMLALDVVSESRLPVVRALAVSAIGFWVVAVDQSHVWAKLVLSILLVPVAPRMLFKANVEAAEPMKLKARPSAYV